MTTLVPDAILRLISVIYLDLPISFYKNDNELTEFRVIILILCRCHGILNIFLPLISQLNNPVENILPYQPGLLPEGKYKKEQKSLIFPQIVAIKY